MSSQRNLDTDRFYDRYSRDPRATSFYRSAEWLAVRKVVIARDHGLCQECLSHGTLTPAKTVHHKLPLLEHWDRRLDLTNLETICDECHNRERADGSTVDGVMFDAEGNVVKV